MKTLWTNQYISDLATEAEIQISTEVPCIYVRFPINVIASQSIYNFSTTATCPLGVQRLTGIIRVTWLGYTVHPVFQGQLQNIVLPLKPAEGDVTSSRPLMYLRNGYSFNQIKFFPSPNATISYDSNSVNSKTGIQNNVVVSGWRIADPSGSTYRIPDYIRETLVRYYVLGRAFKKEGRGQNLEASKYYETQYQILLDRFKKIVEQLFASRTHGLQDAFMNRFGIKPPRPCLPTNFGSIVE